MAFKDENSFQIQTAIFFKRVFPEVEAIHVKNEKKRTPGQGYYDKSMGVKAGVADWIIFDWDTFIELKHGKNKLTTDQKRFLGKMRQLGKKTFTCWTWPEFLAAVSSVTGISPAKLQHKFDERQKQRYIGIPVSPDEIAEGVGF
jgi:hypothetical protein